MKVLTEKEQIEARIREISRNQSNLRELKREKANQRAKEQDRWFSNNDKIQSLKYDEDILLTAMELLAYYCESLCTDLDQLNKKDIKPLESVKI